MLPFTMFPWIRCSRLRCSRIRCYQPLPSTPSLRNAGLCCFAEIILWNPTRNFFTYLIAFLSFDYLFRYRRFSRQIWNQLFMKSNFKRWSTYFLLTNFRVMCFLLMILKTLKSNFKRWSTYFLLTNFRVMCFLLMILKTFFIFLSGMKNVLLKNAT